MLRRLSPTQPASFEFTPANLEWAQAQMTKFPDGRQASAVIPILWRAQEQEGWLTRPAIEYVANLLDMANIRVLEVATFYFMFQLYPVGSVANVQICGTTTCMICGAEDLVRVCRDKIAATPHTLSADGRFSWEEVECLGACTNAPMAQIGKDFYEDLTADKLAALIDAIGQGQVPVPGPQNGRYSCEPLTGLTALTELEDAGPDMNASAGLAVELKDTVKRIDGTETPILTKWRGSASQPTPPDENDPAVEEKAKSASDRARKKGADKAATADEDRTIGDGDRKKRADSIAPSGAAHADGPVVGRKPVGLEKPMEGVAADDLKRISGIGPKLEQMLHEMGIWHFHQIADWGREEVVWADNNLEGFKGRAGRDDWIGQARALAAEISPSTKRDDKTRS